MAKLRLKRFQKASKSLTISDEKKAAKPLFESKDYQLFRKIQAAMEMLS